MGLGLKIVIKTNFKIVDFLDVTFDLSTETYHPTKKTGNQLFYINTESNQPPTIIKHLPVAISRRISDVSCNQEIIDKAKQDYDKALRDSGYTEDLLYVKTPENKDLNKKKKRKQNNNWLNPPYTKNVQTNVGKFFLQLIKKHFLKKHKFYKIFNRNTVKVSYSCMENMGNIIKKHNRAILNRKPTISEDGCNCRRKTRCPLKNKCLITSIIYEANVASDSENREKKYIGLQRELSQNASMATSCLPRMVNT